MKTIDNLNITSITFREYRDLYGSGKEYKKRIRLALEEDFNDRLKTVSNELNIPATEIIRQIITLVISKCEGLTDEDNN